MMTNYMNGTRMWTVVGWDGGEVLDGTRETFSTYAEAQDNADQGNTNPDNIAAHLTYHVMAIWVPNSVPAETATKSL